MIARHLDLRGIPVRVLLLTDPKALTGDAAANYQIIEKPGLRIVPFAAAELSGATWLVDAILGTGAIGEPKSPLAEAIDSMNASGVPILAVDLPSGLDCDTGAAARAYDSRRAHLYVRRGQAGVLRARCTAIRRAITRARYRRTSQADRRRRFIAAALRSVCNVDETPHSASIRAAFHLDLIARFCDKSPLFLAGSAAG